MLFSLKTIRLFGVSFSVRINWKKKACWKLYRLYFFLSNSLHITRRVMFPRTWNRFQCKIYCLYLTVFLFRGWKLEFNWGSKTSIFNWSDTYPMSKTWVKYSEIHQFTKGSMGSLSHINKWCKAMEFFHFFTELILLFEQSVVYFRKNSTYHRIYCFYKKYSVQTKPTTWEIEYNLRSKMYSSVWISCWNRQKIGIGLTYRYAIGSNLISKIFFHIQHFHEIRTKQKQKIRMVRPVPENWNELKKLAIVFPRRWTKSKRISILNPNIFPLWTLWNTQICRCHG